MDSRGPSGTSVRLSLLYNSVLFNCKHLVLVVVFVCVVLTHPHLIVSLCSNELHTLVVLRLFPRAFGCNELIDVNDTEIAVILAAFVQAGFGQQNGNGKLFN